MIDSGELAKAPRMNDKQSTKDTVHMAKAPVDNKKFVAQLVAGHA